MTKKIGIPVFALIAILLIFSGCSTDSSSSASTEQQMPFEWPIVNPGASWNIPRISLPSCMGLLPQYETEWWYYVGYAYDSTGETFSIQLQILRASLYNQNLSLQLTAGFSGIGHGSTYLWSQAYGMGASNLLTSPASLTIPPATNSSFQAVLIPWLAVPAASSGVIPVWHFAYTGGAAVGAVGSRYRIFARGNGAVSTVTGPGAESVSYETTIDVVDRRGMVMEGLSGYVGPDRSKGEHGAASYEYAQPILQITSGTLRWGDKTYHLAGGNLWLDRQVLTRDREAQPTAARALPSLSKTRDIYQSRNSKDFAATLPENLANASKRADIAGTSALYTGTWMGLVFNNGASMVLASFWQKKDTDQWITGTLSGQPPTTTFGNLYFPEKEGQPNGGALVHGLDAKYPTSYDFDVNILRPDAGSGSPHWKSSVSGQTYATAWWIRLGGQVAQFMPELPANIYLVAVTDCTENLMPNASNAFWEGAARICADPECREVIGYAFVEQMGFTTKSSSMALRKDHQKKITSVVSYYRSTGK